MPYLRVNKIKEFRKRYFEYLLQRDKVLISQGEGWNFELLKERNYSPDELYRQYKEQFYNRKRKPQKNEYRALHVIISFKEFQIEDEKIKQFLNSFLKKTFKGKYQYLAVAHKNSLHPHIHILVNPIPLSKGRKIHVNVGFVRKLRKTSDNIARSLNLITLNTIPLRRRIRYNFKEYRESLPHRERIIASRNNPPLLNDVPLKNSYPLQAYVSTSPSQLEPFPCPQESEEPPQNPQS